MTTSPLQLRPCQSEAIDAVFDWWRDRKGEHPLLVLPTGGGKTFTVVALIKRLARDFAGVRVLVLAHRRELLTQFEASIFRVWPFAPVGVFCAGLDRRETNQITIASRDSIRRDVNKLGRFDLVIVDEAHNIDTKREETGYRKILAALKVSNPKLAVLGLTATPFRDGSGYIYGPSHLFAGVAYEVRLKAMIEDGYLVKPVSKQVRAEIDTAELRSVAGDFNQRQLDERATQEKVVDDCVVEWERVAYMGGRRRTLFFAVSVKHAQMIEAALIGYGFSCRVVTGETPTNERRRAIKLLEDGRILALINVGVMTEGTDIPSIDCIALMRPTRSLKLFIQMVGRGLRTAPNKYDCLVLDFGGNLQRFGPVDIAEPAARANSAQRSKTCSQCGSIVGALKRKCPDCGYEFIPPPVKLCPECNEENAPGRRECVACGYEWPIDLDASASTDAAYSGDLGPRLKVFDVERVLVSVATSKKSGKEYLRITFVVDPLNRFYINLMLGFQGYAGRKAKEDLTKLMGENSHWGIPTTPHEAAQLHKDGWLLPPVKRIEVDLASQWNDVKRVEFADAPSEVASA